MYRPIGSAGSLFPKMENIYVATRVFTAVAVAIWMFSTDLGTTQSNSLCFLLSVFALHLVVFYFIWKRKPNLIWGMFILSLVFDAIFVTILIKLTGGAHSMFFLVYYLIIIFSGCCCSLNMSVLISFGITMLYVITNPDLLTIVSKADLGLRIGFAWFFAYTIGFIANRMKQSETKLLKLLNTLNENTVELEHSKVRMETIYEASRALGGLLDFRQITDRVLKIVEDILDYDLCSILLLSSDGKYLQEVAQFRLGDKFTTGLADKIIPAGVVGEVVHTGIPKRVIDLGSHTDYTPFLEGAKSQLVVPMTTHGRLLGVLIAESVRINRFSEIDEKVFSILAASAAMAYENSRLHEKLEQLSVIDELTGIFNFRYFTDRLADEKKRATRYGHPLSLIMVDIDSFKRYNDTYGHEAGNIALKGMAQVIKKVIRDIDVLARYGGEEFVIILPQTGHQEAAQIAERIRCEVDKTEFGGGVESPLMNITVSVGITTYPDNGAETDEIIGLVDRAMYMAKGQGKNRVAVV